MRARKESDYREVLEELLSDLTDIISDIDEMGEAGYHVESIRKRLNENEAMKKACALLYS